MALQNGVLSVERTPRFDPHGNRINRIEGRILISTFQGPFNVELLRVAGASALQLRRALMETGAWGYIEIIERSAMATPEALVEMKRANEDTERSRNRVAAAIVLSPDIEGRRVAESIYSSVWKDVAHPFRIFDRLPDAERWIGEQLGK